MSRYTTAPPGQVLDLPTPPGCLDAETCTATDCACLLWRAQRLRQVPPYVLSSGEREIVAAFGGQS